MPQLVLSTSRVACCQDGPLPAGARPVSKPSPEQTRRRSDEGPGSMLVPENPNREARAGQQLYQGGEHPPWTPPEGLQEQPLPPPSSLRYTRVQAHR